MCYRTPLAAACAFESGHLTLLSGAGEEVVSKEVQKLARRRGARGGQSGQEERHRHIPMLRLIRIAAVLAAARPTLLFRPL